MVCAKMLEIRQGLSASGSHSHFKRSAVSPGAKGHQKDPEPREQDRVVWEFGAFSWKAPGQGHLCKHSYQWRSTASHCLTMSSP